ncbi:CYTH domain-containing protein [Marinobacterium mangrovicola]|uniref:CYTH domain-containing protein n=1 Tax=Marinobacterium mangrovicola TaxID=1476959 RepID=A0A4R1GSD7_9GAMM|nr:CYTH domain-containing protein [Marinobacterium mangrovicola]TCK07512.1 CYTH domain-containing protein [Marinobacterium mangrovicola]
MLTETEIKLRLPDVLDVDPTAIPLFLERLSGNWEQVELFNQYFDTPELALDRAGYALRLRRDGDQCIQTFKGRGESLAGFSVRSEWDWYLSSEQVDLQPLLDLDRPALLGSDTLAALKPLFRTDFQRTKGKLNWVFDGIPVEVEVALDRGAATAEKASSPICELELELRQGPPEALFAFAKEVAAQLPLMPWDSAKAERGYRLLDPERKPLAPKLSRDVFAQPLSEALPLLGSYLLASAQYGSELLSMGTAGAVDKVDQALKLIIEFESLLSHVDATPLSGAFERTTRLHKALFTGLPSAEEQPVELFNRLQGKTDWGVLMLGQSERLYLWHKEPPQAKGASLGELLCQSETLFSGLKALRSEI